MQTGIIFPFWYHVGVYNILIFIAFSYKKSLYNFVVVMPWTILPRRNRRCALSATCTQKPEEEKDARGVTYFMEENVISPREVARFNEHIRN